MRAGIRDARGAPLIDRGCKGFLRRLLGHFEVAHQTNQGRHDPAPVGAVDRLDGFIGVR